MRPPVSPTALDSLLVRSLALAIAAIAMADTPGVAATAPRWRSTGQRVATATPTPDGSALSVTTCADSGPGSLRQAMLDARNNTVIDFSQLTCSTITLTTGALTDPDTDSLHLLATPAVIAGKPKPVVTIDGGGASRIIEHRSGGQLELRGLELRNGHSTEGKGGCIYAMGLTTLTAVTVTQCTATASGTSAALGGGVWSNDEVDLVYSTVSGNSAIAAPGNGYAYGGGVFTSYGFYAVFSTIENNHATGIGYGGGASVLGFATVLSSIVDANGAAYGGGLALFGGDVGPGDLRIENTTLTANHASGFAAGIEANGPLDVYNSTIAFNTGETIGAGHAAGIVMEGAHALDLVSSIVARNTQAGAIRDIGGSGSITGSANLVMNSSLALPAGTLSADPMITNVLGNYGGQALTLGLQPGSPAIDAGSNPLGLLCDQRGGSFVLPFGMVGIFERQKGPAVDIGAFEYGAGDRLFHDGFETVPPFSCYPS